MWVSKKGMASCDPSTQELRQEDHEFKASLAIWSQKEGRDQGREGGEEERRGLKEQQSTRVGAYHSGLELVTMTVRRSPAQGSHYGVGLGCEGESTDLCFIPCCPTAARPIFCLRE